MQLVRLADVLPEAIYDMRYTTTNNVVGRNLYLDQRFEAQLTEPAAHAVLKAWESLLAQQLRLVIWDAYRTPVVQEILQSLEQDTRYVRNDSVHPQGNAVDVTLAASDGKYLDMGTDFDDFSERAHPDSAEITEQQRANRHILSNAMQKAGFKQWPYEWWHFDYLDNN